MTPDKIIRDALVNIIDLYKVAYLEGQQAERARVREICLAANKNHIDGAMAILQAVKKGDI